MPSDVDDRTRERGRAHGPPLRTRTVPAAIPWFRWSDFADYGRAVLGQTDAVTLVSALEERLGHVAPNATVVNRGRDGLRALLASCARVQNGEVVIPAYTDVSVWQAIVDSGYRPVLADVRPYDCNVRPQEVERVLGARTAAVVVCHSFGHPGDLDELLAACGNVPLIEDAAHALGATHGGRLVGSVGTCAFTSFAPFKVIQAHGGGVVWSASPTVAAEVRYALQGVRRLRSAPGPAKLLAHAALAVATSTPAHDLVTYPATRLVAESQMDLKGLYKKAVRPLLKRGADEGEPFTAYQAAVALRQIDDLEGRRARRSKIADTLRSAVDGRVLLTRAGADRESTELMMVAYAHDPKAAILALARHGVGALRSPMTDLSARAEQGGRAEWVSRWIERHAVLLPLHHSFLARHVERLASALLETPDHWVPPDDAIDRGTP